jgi:hypothetical protein
MTKYMLLIYGTEPSEEPTPEAIQAEMETYNAFQDEVEQRGMLVASEALHLTNTARTVRVRDGRTLLTDGPFAETKEILGGYYILDCQTPEEAVEMAAKIPGALTGSVEIRPVVVFS